MRRIAFFPVGWLLPYWSVQFSLSLRSYQGCFYCCLKELLRVKCCTRHCWLRCWRNVWRKAGFPKFWKRWERASGIPGQTVQFQEALWSGSCLLLFWIRIIVSYLSRLSAFKGLKLKCSERVSPLVAAACCSLYICLWVYEKSQVKILSHP